LNGPENTLTFVKLGGSVITDKTREATAHLDVIRRLAGEIVQARAARPDLKLVIGHGSGSFGHFVGRRYSTHLGLPGGGGWEGYAQTAAAAMRLNRIVSDTFLEKGVPVVSVQPSASALCRNSELVSMETRPLRELLASGLVPLVHGDVALDEGQGFTIISTETIFAYLTGLLQPERIILVGVVDGVYNADPLTSPDAVLIPEITPANSHDVDRWLSGSHGIDVTGGMLSKVRAMCDLVTMYPGVRVQIISGLRPGLLEQSLCGPDESIGTVVHR
jgi:isopentenyl phosphate kinase